MLLFIEYDSYMRFLPYIRLSVADEQSTSPERQFEKIEAFARLGGHELVPITEGDYDLDVSGSVSPFDRPGLGPWLQDERLGMWDAICVAKLDRLTRSLFDFVTLASWLEVRGKTLVCLDPMVDLRTPAGHAFASITATFAQFERETIAARVRDAWHRLREGGKYGGGQVPFGNRPTQLVRGWGYEPDPVYAPIGAEMCDRYVRCESLGSITRWLNETGVPTPWNATRARNGKPVRDTMWRTVSVRKILGSPAMLGATVETDGTPVTDDEGMVVYRADALVSRDIWERVQARLAANPVSAKVNTWPLTQVAFCATCKAPMYGATAKYGDKKYAYYCCMHSMRRDGVCTDRRVKADELETAIGDELLALVGGEELSGDKLTADREFSEEISQTVEQITNLYKEIQLGALAGQDVREKQATLQLAQEELARLHSRKHAETRVEPVRTGMTFRQKWVSLNAPGRSEFLRGAKVRVVVSRDELPQIEHQEGPLTPLGIPRTAIIDRPRLHAVIYLGSLGDMLSRAKGMSATVPAA
jgi:DNA invertase Pin-like site-specific DNA recombinase